MKSSVPKNTKGTIKAFIDAVGEWRFNLESYRCYCRKNFPAVNMQAIVDSQARFLDYSMRPGSCSDKNLWSMSIIGQNVPEIILRGMHLVGDAGYTLTNAMMIPYNITEDMPRDESKFNYLHSCTRICVERAFGLLKGRWRVLKRPLNMKSSESIGRTIVSCIVLNNLTINAKNSFKLRLCDRVDPYRSQHSRWIESRPGDKELARAKRDQIKDYLLGLNAQDC